LYSKDSTINMKEFFTDTIIELLRNISPALASLFSNILQHQPTKQARPVKAITSADEKVEELTELCANEFNQHKGLKDAVAAAQDIVSIGDVYMPDKMKKRFLKMNAKKAAASLCNTVVRYLYCCYRLDIEPSQEDFAEKYAKAVSAGAYRSGRTFTYIKSFDKLVWILSGEKINNDSEICFSKKKGKGWPVRKYDGMIFEAKGETIVLIRNPANSHTFLAIKNDAGVFIRGDTWHGKYNNMILRISLKARNGKTKTPTYLYFYKPNGG